MNTVPAYYLTPAAQAAIKQAQVQHIQALDNKRKLRGMRRLLAIAAFSAVAATGASAADFAPTHLMVHVASVHTQPGFNNTNLGVGLRWADAKGDGPVAGVYYNSERSTSAYAGYAWNWQIAGPVSAQLTVGGIGGYKRAAVVPMLLPSVALRLTPLTSVRLSGSPPIRDIPGFAHVSFEFKF